MVKINVFQRIALTALMMVLYIIATRLCKIAITDFVRLSAGPAVLIFSSILLGPISGAFVGGVGDVLGAFLFPYLGMAINPFMSISYVIMGAIPGLFMILFKKINNDRVAKIIYLSFLGLIWLGILIFSLVSKEVDIFNKVYQLNTVAKILIPILSLLMLGITLIFTYWINRHFIKKRNENNYVPSPFYIAFIVMFIEVFFTLLLNPMIRALYYEMPFSVIFFTSLLLAFIYIPGNTLIVSYLCLLSAKIIKTID